MIVANPIYDIVFKYLMEDERIARTILSALMKQEVVEVHMRNNEYNDKLSDNLSIYRIDFGATVIDEKGRKQTTLIEVQKTWVETEVLRFRKYLGFQYSNASNVVGSGRGVHALPMVAIYLLGHKVGKIEAPVVYVNHLVKDYDDNVLEDGISDPFVESLTHNSIIVQIPRLRGKINNRLDKVLSIFDQSLKDGKDSHTIDIDANTYGEDADMQPIIRRLEEAAADSEVRRKMDVEDEFFSVLKSRDSEIMMKDMQLAEKTVAIKKAEEQRAQAEEQRAQAEEQRAQAEEQRAQAEEQRAQAEEQRAQAEEQRAQAEEQRVQAEEQRAQAEERADRIMRNSVIAFLQKEMSAEDISAMLDIDIATVKQIASDEHLA